MPSEASGWSGDVEVAAECFADHVARGGVLVGGSLFDGRPKGGVESDRNNIGGASSEWWAAAASLCSALREYGRAALLLVDPVVVEGCRAAVLRCCCRVRAGVTIAAVLRVDAARHPTR